MFKELKSSKALVLYFVIISITAFALALSNDVLANYFKDAYQVTAYQRGIIEFPRELPGFLVVFIAAVLSGLSDLRISIIAQFMSIIGIFILGLTSPIFAVMLIFIFINSVGMHLFMPLQDSIGMSLFKGDNIGRRMGQYKSVYTAFSMLGGILVFIGFKVGFFSFTGRTKWTFIISASLLTIVMILLIFLERHMKEKSKSQTKVKFLFRKEYKYYYTLVVLFGVQKQMMIVYGPWVLIELLNKKADTMALLGIIGAFIGIFFIPLIGKWLDRFGIKAMLYLDALSFIGVYLVYGFFTAGFVSGSLARTGLPVLLIYVLFIFDRMSNQMGMVRTLYMRSIAVDPNDITPTLSLGVSMDHFVSITSAYLCGIVWMMWGPQYIFFAAAALSLVNLYVATKVKK
jgi:hypothetical protein